ncbi:protein mono-ADP-ribosyltransferase PARP15-like isoform X1 [Callorhinchus milii]|uniref:protein mono-ADP-ribosyltransferase PARP15-like isoform X1 n=1 Tax=Callorhinchus milii TaxID=7868 RepID=UPI001C3F55BF|nr:protein mono-ADP-ribosyltransferase PARP15-like isoform X1 [Callorhinchus milii]
MDFIRDKLFICCRRKRRSESSRVNVHQVPMKALTMTVQIGDIIVMLKKGNITKEIVDVIVNSTNKTLDLNFGVSGAILEAAGSSVKDECKTLGGRSVNALVTGAGKLRCSKIVHIVRHKSDTMIATSVEEVLAICNELNMATVAFPAIGTGQGGIDPQVAINAIFEGIDNFFLLNMASSLKIITIVAFDTTVHDCFAKFFAERQQMSDGDTRGTGSNTPEYQEVRTSLPAFQCTLPASWTPMNDQEYLEVPLQFGSEEYSKVANEFRTSCQNIAVDIIQIDRIQNLKLWESYSVRKKAVDRKYPNMVNERTLYHGTTCEIAEQVKKLGFNRSFCGRNALSYGRGTYFAKNAQYSCDNKYSSPSDQGYKYMFQARVITGKLCLGNHLMKVPSPVDEKDSTNLCDCSVNNVSNPSIFVIFCDDGAYPEYLITFNKKEQRK